MTGVDRGRDLDLRGLSGQGPIHFMGVGGAGMCALAEAIHRGGGTVTGCDLQPGASALHLRELGIDVEEGHDPSHLEGAVGLVVSAAVPSDHPEIEAAADRGIPVLKRARALGLWVNEGKVVAVAGTHGKTTTTAMATEILTAADLDPTGFVGGAVAAWDGNFRPGSDRLFVVEADEYDRSFHALEPTVAVVTNVEADHLDVYGDLEGVREAFRTFVGKVGADGRVAVCGDDPEASRLLPSVGPAGYSYGLNAGLQLRATDLRPSDGGTRFRVYEEGLEVGEAVVAVPGAHNVRNALGAAAAARHLGADWPAVFRGLAAFRGVGRRFQRLGHAAGILVVDDYAHHPTEVRATLEAARHAFPERRIVVVFQPHLYSRTRDFHREFGAALAAADRVWVTDVYPAREEPIPGVSGELVAAGARAEGMESVTYHPEVGTVADAVVAELAAGDVCLTMGAGSVEHVGPAVLDALGAPHA